MNKQTLYSVIVTVLLAIVIIAALVLWSKNSNLSGSNEDYMQEVDSLTVVKTELLSQLDQLQAEYESIAAYGDSLSGSLTEAQATIEKLEKIRKQSTADLNSLRQEVKQLQGLKTNLSDEVAKLREENAALLARNEELTVQLVETSTANEALTSQRTDLETANQSLNDEVNRLKVSNIKATGFQINVERKNEKVTARGRSARRLNISFDVINVPAEHQGLHTIYLVLSDANATPLKVETPIRAQIKGSDGEVAEIEAQYSKEVNLTANQRVSFTHELQEKLQAGMYQASVYSDLGFLGLASFQVR